VSKYNALRFPHRRTKRKDDSIDRSIDLSGIFEVDDCVPANYETTDGHYHSCHFRVRVGVSLQKRWKSLASSPTGVYYVKYHKQIEFSRSDPLGKTEIRDWLDVVDQRNLRLEKSTTL
jgi:hypothetical protein